MAILKPIPREEIRKRYTHKGWFLGICPVYIGNVDSYSPELAVRNGVPDWLLDVADGLFDAWCSMALAADPFYEPNFPILITGEIRKEQS